jgi:hypothetical protein
MFSVHARILAKGEIANAIQVSHDHPFGLVAMKKSQKCSRDGMIHSIF